jgi:hypothetical protein
MPALLQAALFFVVVMYVGAPLLILATQRQNANPSLQAVADATTLANPYLTNGSAALEALGFQRVGFFNVAGLAPGVRPTVGYFLHRGNGDTAIVASLVAPTKTVTFTEFATRFADQSAVTTGNSAITGSYKRPANKPVYHFPEIQDLRRLYAIHQGAMRQLRFGAAKDLPAPGAETARLLDGLQREMADQVPTGILRLDAVSGTYRPTLYGAYRMTWAQLPPFKQIAKMRRRARAQRLLRELESDPAFAAGL